MFNAQFSMFNVQLGSVSGRAFLTFNVFIEPVEANAVNTPKYLCSKIINGHVLTRSPIEH